MTSIVRELLDRTEEVIWHRGEAYADQSRVQIVNHDEKGIEAVVAGKKNYRVIIKYAANGIQKECDCPYAAQGICKHIVAAAIVWDEFRGYRRPNPEDVHAATIQPSPISRHQLSRCFAAPLNADLDIIRIAVDHFGFRHKPHAVLPKCPVIESREEAPLSLLEVKAVMQEMASWTKRSQYHRYLCAGEMAAALSEALDVIYQRLPATLAGEAVEIMLFCLKWYYTKFSRIIDDSDGVWIFPKARIGRNVAWLLNKYPDLAEWSAFNKTAGALGREWEGMEWDAQSVTAWQGTSL